MCSDADGGVQAQRRERLASAVSVVARFLDGELSYDAMRAEVASAPADDDLDELLEMIAHTPRRGGLLGVSSERHDAYQEKLRAALRSLQSRNWSERGAVEMSTLFVLVAEGEVSFFSTTDELARYIEAPDLERARAYDSEGRSVKLTSPPVRRRFGFVNVPPVTATITEERRVEELREALRIYVVDRARLPDDALGDESLHDLLRRALAITGARG